MDSIIKRAFSPFAVALRAVVLTLVICATGQVWATDLQVTITDNTVVIDNDNAGTFDHMTFYVNSPVVTIPASETLPLGTQIELTSIALGKRASGSNNTRPETLSITGTDGTVYTSDAIVESGTFTNAGCTKEVYSFSGKGCVLTVGLSYAMSFKNANGSDFTTLNGRTAKNSASLFGTTVYNPNYTVWLPVQELKGEIVGSTDFTLVTGANTNIKNTDTTKPTYLHNATGWISTDTASSGEIKLVNGPAGYALTVNNGNSIGSSTKNRTSVWKKLSGDGLLTTTNNNWQTPAVKIYDASEFTGSINASAGNVYLAVIFCAEEDTFSPSVYEEIGSKSGLIYIKPGTSVTVASGATWTAVNGIVNKGALTVNGTVASAISNNGGTVTLNAGASVPSFGSQRDFTGFTVDSSVPVKIVMTTEEYGKGSVSVTGANGISSITVLAPDGTTEVGTITPEEGAGALETGVKTSGLSTWCDYEFNGDKSNTGVDKTGLTSDVNTATYPEIFNSSMLYTYTHPWRNISYPDSWTAVVRCTVPELENAVVVMFGTYGAGAIGLIAGPNPEEQMLLVSTPGSAATTSEAKHFTTLATMNVKDATTAQHVYVFTKDGTTVNVYCDGEKVLDNYELASATLGGGLQVGSLHGGVVQGNIDTGLVRFGAGENQISSLTLAQQQNARIDCMRMFDYIVSPEQIAALSVEFPAVKLYRATAAADTDTTWGNLTWTPAWDGGNTQSKVILTTEGDATIELPESITVDEVQLNLAADSTLTLVGPGSLAVTQPITIENGTLELTGTVTLAQDTALNGSVVFDAFTAAGTGALKLSNGATVGVESGSVVVTPLGAYTLADGTVVDSVYTGDGVKLIPYADVVASITQGGSTLYYSDLDTALTALLGSTEETVSFSMLNGNELSFAYTLQLKNLGYYVDNGTVTKAVAKIRGETYGTLAAAVAAATGEYYVQLLRNSSEAITLNKAITLDETGVFSGTLTGAGTLTFATFRNNPSITFDNWTGTVVLPEFAAAATVLNKYGVAGSTVVLKGITGGWLGETSPQKMDVAPVLQLDGDVTIKGFSTSWDYTFAEITGTGNFSLDPTDNHPKSATITKIAAGFTGTVASSITATLTIGGLNLSSLPACDAKVLALDGTGDVSLDVGNIKVGEASLPAKYKLERRTDGDDGDGFYVYYYGTIFSVY